MKFLKKSQINFRNVKDDSIAIQITGEVTMDTTDALLLPKGTTAQKPGGASSINTPKRGHMRFNLDTNEVEVYQGESDISATWRSLRYKESTQIVQQDLGAGNDIEYIFGPLNPAPPSTALVDSKATWSGANLLVLVENVIQLNNVNFVIIQNPCNLTSSAISFNATTKKIISSNQTLADFEAAGFWIGQTVNITGSRNNNITVVIDELSPTEITVSESLTDETQGFDVHLVGLSSSTGPSHGSASPGQAYPSGYYLKFDQPVPEGSIDPKYVTVLHGFDR